MSQYEMSVYKKSNGDIEEAIKNTIEDDILDKLEISPAIRELYPKKILTAENLNFIIKIVQEVHADILNNKDMAPIAKFIKEEKIDIFKAAQVGEGGYSNGENFCAKALWELQNLAKNDGSEAYNENNKNIDPISPTSTPTPTIGGSTTPPSSLTSDKVEQSDLPF